MATAPLPESVTETWVEPPAPEASPPPVDEVSRSEAAAPAAEPAFLPDDEPFMTEAEAAAAPEATAAPVDDVSQSEAATPEAATPPDAEPSPASEPEQVAAADVVDTRSDVADTQAQRSEATAPAAEPAPEPAPAPEPPPAATLETGEADRLRAEIFTKDAEIRQLTARVADLEAQVKTALADFDNYRRRQDTEKQNLVHFAGERVILNLLPVADNLSRAMATEVPDVSGAIKALENLSKFVKGFDMINRQMGDTLAKAGVGKIEAVGQIFDPNMHEAVMMEETTEHPDQMVLMELQPGYILNGKVIRPAMVKVANNPSGVVSPAPAASPSGNDEAGSGKVNGDAGSATSDGPAASNS